MGPSRTFLSKPVIAAVAGYAVAGGLELAFWCDLRVAEEGAIFGVFCRRWGVPLIDGGTVRLPRIIGQGRALDMILTGRWVGAAEALSFGLANRVVPKGQARQAAEALAAEIAAFPERCMKSDRLSAYEQWDLPWNEALLNELRHGYSTIKSGETGPVHRTFACAVLGRGMALFKERILMRQLRPVTLLARTRCPTVMPLPSSQQQHCSDQSPEGAQAVAAHPNLNNLLRRGDIACKPVIVDIASR